MTKEFVTSLYNHERCETHVDTKTQIEKKRRGRIPKIPKTDS